MNSFKNMFLCTVLLALSSTQSSQAMDSHLKLNLIKAKALAVISVATSLTGLYVLTKGKLIYEPYRYYNDNDKESTTSMLKKQLNIVISKATGLGLIFAGIYGLRS